MLLRIDLNLAAPLPAWDQHQEPWNGMADVHTAAGGSQPQVEKLLHQQGIPAWQSSDTVIQQHL